MFRRLLFITVTAFILTPAAASAGNVERWREDFAPAASVPCVSAPTQSDARATRRPALCAEKRLTS
jgi:hypothetical protein